MSAFINLTNIKFGRLTPLARDGIDKNGAIKWLCKCDCGKEVSVSGISLRRKMTKSCGCLHDEGPQLKHGHAIKGRQSITYRSWQHMIDRCTNKNSDAYKYYGGRDKPIIVCDRWDINKGGSFENFLEDMGERPPGLSLDRIDNNLGYFKENCRWATRKQQMRNTRYNHIETYKNEDKCTIELSEKYNINPRTLSGRLNRDKMTINEAIEKPVKKYLKEIGTVVQSTDNNTCKSGQCDI